MQIPNIRKTRGPLAKRSDVDPIIEHLRSNAPHQQAGIRARALRHPVLPVAVGAALTITNPRGFSVYLCETQLPDSSYPPYLPNHLHTNNVVGELWDCRSLPIGGAGTPLTSGSIVAAQLWGRNEVDKRYVFILFDTVAIGGAELVEFTAIGGSGTATASFTYTFNTADGVTHSSIVPANAEDRSTVVDLLAAAWGIWFPASSKLYVIEGVDWATCSSPSTPSVEDLVGDGEFLALIGF